MDNDAATGGGRPRTDELTALLRSAGVTADIRQREAIRDVFFATVGTLGEDEIADIVAVVLARSARQHQRVREMVIDWLKRDSAPAKAAKPTPADPIATDQTDPLEEDAEKPEPSLRRVLVDKVKARRDWPLWLVLAPLVAVGLAAVVKWLPSPCTANCGGVSPPELFAGVSRVDVEIVLVSAIAIFPVGYLFVMLVTAIGTWRERRDERRRQTARRGGGTLPAGPVLFNFESIGGRTFRFFERAELQKIARSVPRRRGETPGRRLDAMRSVATTAQTGLPTLRYRTLPEPWPLIVLADRHAPGRQWNDLPADLAAGLSGSGLLVLSGSFPGRLDRFDVEEVGRVDLVGLLTQDALLLLVGNGSRLSHRGSDMVTLRRLADSGRALWIDEREERDWQPRADAPLLAGLPVCPATGERIVEALRAIGRRSINAPRPDRLPSAWPGAGLGDALGWAAACAMVQPIGVALAHDLRRTFFPHLTANTFGRLVALEGATLDTDGLRFDDRLLGWLRGEFARRFSGARQDAILDAILAAIDRSRETLTDGSLAHLTWRWYRVRVLLQRKPDDALAELAALQDSLLGASVRRDLEKLRLPGTATGSSGLPMLRLPQRPAEFADGIAALGLSLGGVDIRTWALPDTAPSSISFDDTLVALAMASGGDGKIVALLENGSLRLGTAFDAETTLLSDATSSRLLYNAEGPPRRGIAGSRTDTILSISPSGDYVALAGAAGLPQIFAVGPPVLEETIEAGTDKELMSRASPGVTAMAFHSTQPLLVLALRSGGVLFVDLTKGASATFALGELHVTAMTLSSEGDVVVMATDDRRVVMEPTPVAASQSPTRPESDIEVDFEIRVLAAGPRGWPLVVAGEDRLMTFAQPIVTPQIGPSAIPPPVPLQVRGPWPIPTDSRPQLALIEEDSMVAVLAAGRLKLMHLETGLDLLRDKAGADRSRTHAGLGVARNLALLWGKQRDRIDVCALERHGSPSRESVPA